MKTSMVHYEKGARAERELTGILQRRGYSVVRAAGSGVAGYCPDLLAFKHGRQFAFECKNWKGGRVAVKKETFRALAEWEENTGITTMVAWRIPRGGWLFLHLRELEENPRSFSLTRERAERIARGPDEVLL